MLTEWKNNYPGRVENIFRAMSHVSPSQLADRELFDFMSLGEEQDRLRLRVL
jgi:tRNA 2-thiocytidine biosynthesis protein TtcA